jgi:trehalose/maltose transport system permease protein
MRRVVLRAGYWGAAGLVGAVSLLPLGFALAAALGPGAGLDARTYLPERIDGRHFRTLVRDTDFPASALRSLLLAGAVAGSSLLLATAAAFALGRVAFKGRSLLLASFLALSLLPHVALLAGLYHWLQALGLLGTLPGLGLAYATFTLPFSVWLLTAAMREIPSELEEAAYLDGANPFQVVLRVFVPMLRRPLLTTALLAFIAAWNELLFALSFAGLNPDARTLPVATVLLASRDSFELPWGLINAALVLATLPPVILAFMLPGRLDRAPGRDAGPP